MTVPDADFDSDQDVNGDDFLAWQRGNGDADGDGITDRVDLEFWTEQYGRNTSGALQSLASVYAVPEPGSGLLVFVAAAVAVAARVGRRG